MPDILDSTLDGPTDGPSDGPVDGAFRGLTRDVSAVSRPRGAAAAIRRARGRRLAVAAAVTVVLLGLGGLAVDRLAGSEQSAPGPAGSGRSVVEDPAADALPVPAPLDAEALETATAGWVSGWSDGVSGGTVPAPRCLEVTAVPDPAAAGRGSRFRTASGGVAAATYLRYGGESAALATVETIRSTCVSIPDGAGPLELALPAGATGWVILGDEASAWLLQTGDRLAVLQISGPALEPDAQVRDAVARAVLAALRGYDDWQVAEGSSGSATAPPPAVELSPPPQTG